MDCEWQKRLMVSSELATDRRNLRMLRRPRIRRKENSARASRRPVRSASVTSRYSLCLSSDLTSSKTGDGRSASASVSGFTASLQNAFFRYIYSQSVFMREREIGPRGREQLAWFVLLRKHATLIRSCCRVSALLTNF